MIDVPKANGAFCLHRTLKKGLEKGMEYLVSQKIEMLRSNVGSCSDLSNSYLVTAGYFHTSNTQNNADRYVHKEHNSFRGRRKSFQRR